MYQNNLIGQKFGKWTVIGKYDKKCYWLCKCECGAEKPLQSSQLKHGKGEGCRSCWKSNNQTKDLTGKVFGKWTVINKDDRKSNKLDYWLCKCECGREKSLYGSHLLLEKSMSCRKCSEHKHKGRLNSRIWNRIVYGARKRNFEVSLGEKKEAKDWLYDLLYVKQDCRCALSNLPIRISNTIKGDMKCETTASLDRIDSKKGYTKDNVQWVHKWVNKMKLHLDQDEFIMFCEAIAKHKGKLK